MDTSVAILAQTACPHRPLVLTGSSAFAAHCAMADNKPKKMVELRRWPTSYEDQGWKGKLDGIQWVQKDGYLTEYWDWTGPLPEESPGKSKGKSKGKNKGNVGKGKGTGKNNVGKGKGKGGAAQGKGTNKTTMKAKKGTTMKTMKAMKATKANK